MVDMTTTRKPITYVYEMEGHRIEVTRHHTGTAYARNGNVGNPTEYFTWSSTVDGEHAVSNCPSRAEAYEHARATIQGIPYINSDRHHLYRNVRNFNVVRDEMKANYVQQFVAAEAVR